MANTGYFLKEAFAGFSRGKAATSSAIAITTFTFLILAVFLLIAHNLRLIIIEAKKEVSIEAYIYEGVANPQYLGKKILDIEGVAGVEYISKEDAEEEFRSSFENDASLLGVLEKNYFPASYRIKLSEEMHSPQWVAEVASKVVALKEVEDVDYMREWLDNLTSAIHIIQVVGLVVGILLGLISIVVIGNAIRLTVLARSERISIMRLVGATSGFVRIPFLIEGLLVGIIGGAMAVGLVYLGCWLLNREALLTISYLPGSYNLALVGSAGLIGVLGAFIAVRKHLKV